MPPDVKTPHAESLSLEAWCTSPEWAMPSKWMEVWGTFSLEMEWGWSTAWRPPPRPSAGPWYVEVFGQAESALPPVHALDKSVSRSIWGALKSLWKLCKVKTGQTFGRVWASLNPLGATWISPGMITKKLAFYFNDVKVCFWFFFSFYPFYVQKGSFKQGFKVKLSPIFIWTLVIVQDWDALLEELRDTNDVPGICNRIIKWSDLGILGSVPEEKAYPPNRRL